MVPLVLVLGAVILLVLMLRGSYSGRHTLSARRTRAARAGDGGDVSWMFAGGDGGASDCGGGDAGGGCGGDGGGGGGGD